MKRLLAAIILLIFGFIFLTQAATPAHAFMPPEWCQQSDEKTADAAIDTGGGFFYGIEVMTDGTNAVTIDVYDNTAASGTKLIPTWVVTTSATDRRQTFNRFPSVPYSTGIYVDITTSGTVKYMLYYREG